MNTFHSRQIDCDRHARKNENTGTLNFTSQIAPSICTVRHTKRVKTNATIFKSRCSRTVLCYRFDRVEALPLVRTRILRLARISPLNARRPARRPRNSWSVTAATPPNVRQGGSQDNLRDNTQHGHSTSRATVKAVSRKMTRSNLNHDIQTL